MDNLLNLIYENVHDELIKNIDYPFLTLDTITQRLYRKIQNITKVRFYENEKTILFHEWHIIIFDAYKLIQANLSQEEKGCIERVLTKDSPHISELVKFACCWYKYNAQEVCMWFAVDGFLGNHPKSYAPEAFSTQFRNHNNAVRKMYKTFDNPEKIKEIIERVVCLREGDEPCAPDLDPNFENCVKEYMENVEEEEMRQVVSERRAKMQQMQAPKRKKFAPSSPTP